MAKVEYIKCDRCGKTPAIGCYTFLERRPDGAGSTEDWHLCFDLCLSCFSILLSEVLDRLGTANAKEIFKKHAIETREG